MSSFNGINTHRPLNPLFSTQFAPQFPNTSSFPQLFPKPRLVNPIPSLAAATSIFAPNNLQSNGYSTNFFNRRHQTQKEPEKTFIYPKASQNQSIQPTFPNNYQINDESFNFFNNAPKMSQVLYSIPVPPLPPHLATQDQYFANPPKFIDNYSSMIQNRQVGNSIQMKDIPNAIPPALISALNNKNNINLLTAYNFVEYEEDSDGETNDSHPKNWRIAYLFNGKSIEAPIDYNNSERPQNDSDKTFPVIVKNQNLLQLPLITANIPSNERSLQPNDHLFVNDALNQLQQRSHPPSKESSPRPQQSSNKPSTSNTTQFQHNQGNNKKRFANQSLTIVNGKRIHHDSRECFAFANNKCIGGIFCQYKHDKSIGHHSTKVCNRLLSGTCRNGPNCRDGPHLPLMPHQLPVCNYYLYMSCGLADCPYLHVKHSDHLYNDPCWEFNQGTCQKGITVCYK